MNHGLFLYTKWNHVVGLVMVLLLWFFDSDGLLSMTPSRRKLIEELTQKSRRESDDDDIPSSFHDEDTLLDHNGDN